MAEQHRATRNGNRQPERVLFVVNTFPPGYTGGAEVINYHTCQGLRRRGVDVSILVLNNRMSQSIDERYEYDGLPVRRVGWKRRRSAWTDLFDVRAYRTVRAELRRVAPDLVHVHNVSGATLAPYLACRAADVPVVNTLHDLWLLCPNNMLYRADGSFCDPAGSPGRCRTCFRRYDYWADVPHRRRVWAGIRSNVRFFIAPSQAVIRAHVRAGYEASRFRHVPHGLGAVGPALACPEIDAIVASRRAHHTLVFAGGGTEIKGAQVVLDALPALERYVDRLRLVVVGAGEERLLKQFIEQAPEVKMLGLVPFQAIGRLYAAADLVLVPSTCAEAFSLVTLESLRAGTPVVGSDLGGIPELIRDGETGYLVPAGDAMALAQCVLTHLARPAHVRRAMRGAAAEAAAALSLERHVEGVLQVYREAWSG